MSMTLRLGKITLILTFESGQRGNAIEHSAENLNKWSEAASDAVQFAETREIDQSRAVGLAPGRAAKAYGQTRHGTS